MMEKLEFLKHKDSNNENFRKALRKQFQANLFNNSNSSLSDVDDDEAVYNE